MEKRTFKNKVYQQLANIVKGMSNPHRLEILELLAQGRFSVAEIAEETDMSGANASQHLQVLKQAQLVSTQREGNHVYYELAGESVYKAWKSLRDLGIERVAEVERVLRQFRESRQSVETLSSSQLADKMKHEQVTIIDVRPQKEFSAGHIAGALNIPVDQLSDKIDALPEDREIVAYCRGPFCVFADDAVELLSKKGFNAKRLDEGFPEWMLDELPVEYSSN
ncbi:metalloregulator ArsR/SmtB family transcription factor [Aliifodinibius sp. S!AR15-10]|uniref:ArsR/SmtB family transcription factor n=1 Tax=Aliifodinibius sp. S!AR15-10 TaxID=2950437 RepID=UPI00285E1611|nr:metalloregulator ArsR/SmtB family transcription factor [Aliifodinibius sp. S!AR15-10]MDR8391889.1 metalloregulator ArsR/SmtB family transcription factor [Aliifodinibius sp. S!AR15-10]